MSGHVIRSIKSNAPRANFVLRSGGPQEKNFKVQAQTQPDEQTITAPIAPPFTEVPPLHAVPRSPDDGPSANFSLRREERPEPPGPRQNFTIRTEPGASNLNPAQQPIALPYRPAPDAPDAKPIASAPDAKPIASAPDGDSKRD